jgi:phosphotransferase system  glucose/maltose/N-acetylglucosamine-specific IIC component
MDNIGFVVNIIELTSLTMFSFFFISVTFEISKSPIITCFLGIVLAICLSWLESNQPSSFLAMWPGSVLSAGILITTLNLIIEAKDKATKKKEEEEDRKEAKRRELAKAD